MNDELLTALFQRYDATHAPEVLEEIVAQFLPLSRAIARRYAGQGVEREDLEQVAAMALVKAVQRFQPERGLRFTTYATTTIAGEVRHEVRDRGSAMRMNRDTRSQLHRLARETERLQQQLQREPSLKELSAAMSITPDALLALLDEREKTSVLSLHTRSSDEEDASEMLDLLGDVDVGFAQVEERGFYEWALEQVTPLEGQLLQLRFRDRLNQRETARQLGVSQMQVSRLERRVLERLRRLAEKDE